MSGPKFQRGDIIHTLSPHADSPRASKHWALVVADPLNCSNNDYVVIQITTTLYSGKTDFRLSETDPEFPQTGLDHASTFRCHKLFPLAESQVRTKKGSAGPQIMKAVEDRLRKMPEL